MMPGFRPCIIEPVFDRTSKELIYGRILSNAWAPAKEIDTVNALILSGKMVYDFRSLMCAGQPVMSSESSPKQICIVAAQALVKCRCAKQPLIESQR